jgi:hypothetical protein
MHRRIVSIIVVSVVLILNVSAFAKVSRVPRRLVGQIRHCTNDKDACPGDVIFPELPHGVLEGRLFH